MIGDGPFLGSPARLIRFDTDANTAQVEIWVPVAGQRRRAIAVVTLNLLRALGSDRWTSPDPPVSAPRGRPRLIDDVMLAKMRTMSESGRYTRAEIAQELGVSKSSVAHYLGPARSASLD